MLYTLFSRTFNTTVITTTTVNRVTTTIPIVQEYDYDGAALYVAVILIWYSTGLALMLFLQVRPRTFQSQFLLDYETNKSMSFSTRRFGNYRSVEADSAKKHILTELRDPDRRQRLWKIYYSSKEQQNEPHPRYYQTITADTQTIGRINRKLADIHRVNARNRDESTRLPPDLTTCTNKYDTAKPFHKRFSVTRATTATPAPNQETVNEVSNEPEQPLRVPITTVEVTCITCEQQQQQKQQQPIIAPLTNGSRRRASKIPNRFIVEKVPEANNNVPVVQQDIETTPINQ